MKIVFVNHTFPPFSYAGSELCVLNMAKELIRRGHEAVVFYRFSDAALDEYTIQSDEYEGVPASRINQTYRFVNRFHDIYHNPVLGARFGCWLREQRADIVHFHHLTNLSLTLPAEARAAGCRVVMTLHDYWLLCQRGQLLRRDLSCCGGPSPMRCRACLAPQLVRGRWRGLAERVLRVIQPASKERPLIDCLQPRRANITAPDPHYVSRTEFPLGGGPVLLMHPPAQAVYPARFSRKARFVSAVALHPEVYDKPGGGVRFEVWRGDERLFDDTLDPKHEPADRGWRPVEFTLEEDAKQRPLTLRTVASTGDPQFCSAGWLNPRVLPMQMESPNSEIDLEAAASRRRIKALLENAADLLVHLSPQAHEGIAHRTNRVRRVFDEVDVFISPSEFLRRFFIQFGLPQDKILFSDNGFPPAPAPRERAYHDPIRFGYIGTWIPSKGVDLLLEAFRQIDPSRARLRVYGFFPGYDGYEDYPARLRSLAGPAVEFHGKYDPSEVYGILSELDCIVVPSIWWENSPMTVHEAFQMRVPVITADVGGMVEQVRNGGGLTFQHRDAASLRRVIEGLIAEPRRLAALRETIPAVKSIGDHLDELLLVYQRLMMETNSS